MNKTKRLIISSSYCFYALFFSYCLNSTRRIFPEEVLGSSSINSIFLGYLYGAVDCFTWFCNSFIRFGLSASSRSCKTINAFTTFPEFHLGLQLLHIPLPLDALSMHLLPQTVQLYNQSSR